MLFDDDVLADRQAKARALASWLGAPPLAAVGPELRDRSRCSWSAAMGRGDVVMFGAGWHRGEGRSGRRDGQDGKRAHARVFTRTAFYGPSQRRHQLLDW